MGAVEVRRIVPTALGAVWDALTDFGAYGRWIPLTSMRTDPPPVRLGWGFAGFTGLGPVARFAVRKTGRVLCGWAAVELTATDTGGTEVVWREEIVPRPEPLGRLVAPVSERITARLFAEALDRMLEAAAARTSST